MEKWKKIFLKTNSKSEFTEITNTTPPKEKEKEKGEMFQATLLALEVET